MIPLLSSLPSVSSWAVVSLKQTDMQGFVIAMKPYYYNVTDQCFLKDTIWSTTIIFANFRRFWWWNNWLFKGSIIEALTCLVHGNSSALVQSNSPNQVLTCLSWPSQGWHSLEIQNAQNNCNFLLFASCIFHFWLW